MPPQDPSQRELMLASFLHRPLPAGLEPLTELALDLRWQGSQSSDRLWQMLDPETWEQTENPFMILQNVSQARLEEVARDERFREQLRQSLEDQQGAMRGPTWFDQHAAKGAVKSVAYFSMEFGLSEALPIYSGGLGLLAGDFLKTAGDMGVPVTGIGLLYQQGYFRQVLDADGWQLEAFPYNDPITLPVIPVQKPDGGWLRIRLELPGRELLLRVWQAYVDSVTLYLLDSNDPLNSPWDRGITATLYPAGHERGQERRFLQEIVLGIGGWLALEALGIEPEVCHLNEGHAALVTLARARSCMRKLGISFSAALRATRAGNVFTTHTAVPAGFDRFEPALVRRYADYFAQQVGVPAELLLDLGRQRPGDPDEPLNIAYLALRGSGLVNGVSRLHGSVSRRIFQELFPRWPQDQVPVGYVTNGVHIPSWDSDAAGDLWTRVCGKRNWQEAMQSPEPGIETVSDADLWSYRTRARQELIAYIRRRLTRQEYQHGTAAETQPDANPPLDPNILTLGFARRFATYKRPNLLLKDMARLERLLCDPAHPAQLIVAGKAHPNDEEGKRMVQAMARFAARPEVRHRVVFLEDHDIALMQQLAAGIDVWINNPRRPWEACGTSGMKLLVNGGLNLSELDGWWVEAYTPEVGWALGDGLEHEDPGWDDVEAVQLYETLERRIVPEFYTRNAEGIPEAWVQRVRTSMARLTPRFSSYRMLQEYVEQFYVPAASAFRRRMENNAASALALEAWRQQLDAHWREVRFGQVHVTAEGDAWRFAVQVYCGALNPDALRVELYANARNDTPATVATLQRTSELPGSAGGYLYTVAVSAARPAEHYTPRITAYHPEALIPLEANHILWQR